MPTFVEGSAVLIEDGLRFDLARVLEACEAVIDACAGAFGAPTLCTAHPQHARLSWPDPARKAFRDTWIGAGKVYDAVCEPLIALFDPLSLKLFPLGTTWCEYREDTDELFTPSGRPISELDPTPSIAVYGGERGANLYALPSTTLVEIVERLVAGPLAGLGLGFRKSEPIHVSTDMASLGQFATILLPHGVYGAGRGPIRVRCAQSHLDALS